MSNPLTAINLFDWHAIHKILTVFPNYCIDLSQMRSFCGKPDKKGSIIADLPFYGIQRWLSWSFYLLRLHGHKNFSVSWRPPCV